MMTVTTRLNSDGVWICRTSNKLLGEFVVSNENTEFKAQNKAAKFLDSNFPGEPIEWENGYHGGDTSHKTGDILGHYHDNVGRD